MWKGQRFPIAQCISGWAMLNHAIAVVPDIEQDERIPVDAYRPTFVKSLVMVPIGGEHPVGAIGAYWARTRQASLDELAKLESLASATADAIARVGLEDAPFTPSHIAGR